MKCLPLHAWKNITTEDNGNYIKLEWIDIRNNKSQSFNDYPAEHIVHPYSHTDNFWKIKGEFGRCYGKPYYVEVNKNDNSKIIKMRFCERTTGNVIELIHSDYIELWKELSKRKDLGNK